MDSTTGLTTPEGRLHRIRGTIRKLWVLRETRRHLLTFLVLLFVNVLELVYVARWPCVMSPGLYAEDCGGSVRVGVYATYGKLAFALILINTPVRRRIYRESCRKFLGRLPGASSDQEVGWAAASSKDIFDNVVWVTKASQKSFILGVLVATVIALVVFALTDEATWQSPTYRQYIHDICLATADDINNGHSGTSTNAVNTTWTGACVLFGRWKETVAICFLSTFMYCGTMTMLLRDEMFGPAFIAALEKRQVKCLLRCLNLHWFVLPLGAALVAAMIVSQKLRLMTGSQTDVVLFMFVTIGYFSVLWTVMAWSSNLDGVVREFLRWCVVRLRQSRQKKSHRTIRFLSSASLHSHASQHPRQNTERFMAKVFKSFARAGVASSSFRQKQLQIVSSTFLCLVVSPSSSWWALGVTWLAKLAAVVLMLSTYDYPSSFETLARKDPGFGLVVDAHHLRAAIRATLSNKSYTGPLTKSFASYFRMADTLTLSYRWNPSSVEIMPGVKLNMSTWQLEQLELAITTSRCIYVWLDCLALPQQRSELQSTLLARMMAVYATSKKTVALRSLESEGSRYHQRAWTIQEYCNANLIEVVTEQPDESSSLDGMTAMTKEEELQFPQIREWHKSRAQFCRPYWLWGFSTVNVGGELEEAMSRLKELVPRLVCQYPVDKIRSLYPMIFNTPCENQDELLGLVNDVVTARSKLKRQGSDISGAILSRDQARLIDLPRASDFASMMQAVSARSRRGADIESVLQSPQTAMSPTRPKQLLAAVPPSVRKLVWH